MSFLTSSFEIKVNDLLIIIPAWKQPRKHLAKTKYKRPPKKAANTATKKPEPPKKGPTSTAAAPTADKKEDKSKIEKSQAPNPVMDKRRMAVFNWINRTLDVGVQALRDEFRGLAKYTAPESTYTAFKTNQPLGKNRYQDVPCQDQHRVVLTLQGTPTDYIHANYVSTPMSEKRFICTQGPLDVTIEEFWVMVIQEQCDSILMLCQCIETGKYKCAQYWPENQGDTKQFLNNTVTVTHKSNSKLEVDQAVVVTFLGIKLPDGTEREVRHYQWNDWPDRGVPPVKLTAFELLSCVRGSKAPLLIHCSAGIGRTGTICAIEYILEKMMAGVECANMADLLKELRGQRAWLIQNDMQYLYVHRIMICYFLEKHAKMYPLSDGYKEKFTKFIADYSAATGT